VSSIPGANTLFEGQQINEQTHREERRRQIDERTQRGETQKRNRRNITEGDHRTDNRREIKEPLRDTTSEGPSTL
jgi:hypothetical protein